MIVVSIRECANIILMSLNSFNRSIKSIDGLSLSTIDPTLHTLTTRFPFLF